MSTRNNSKRKAKRNSQESNSDEPVSNSSRLENNENALSSEQFEEITKNVKNSLQRDIKDAVNAVEMRILQAIKENSRNTAQAVPQEIESPGLLQSQPENSNIEFMDQNLPGTSNTIPINQPLEIDITCDIERRNMVTGANEHRSDRARERQRTMNQPENRPPSQSSINMHQFLQDLQNVAQLNPRIPKMPKSLSTSMPTFDGKNEKFELFEDLFQTSLKIHPQLTEEEKINYFHSLMRGEALQTFRNLTLNNRNNIGEILTAYRRRYVRPQSVATARCKWEKLAFDPTKQTFQDFIEQYQKLAREAYGNDAPKYIELSFYAKMPAHLKRVLNQARLETKPYEEMVEHLEREMELNGLCPPETASITGINSVEMQEERPQPRRKLICNYCGKNGHTKNICRTFKSHKEKAKGPQNSPENVIPKCETCGKGGHLTQACFNGANWENRPQNWRAPDPKPQNNDPETPDQDNSQTDTSNNPKN